MSKSNSRNLFIMVIIFSAMIFPARTQDVVDNTTLKGKYMFGYQGWQRTTGDGCNRNWQHWASGTPNGSNLKVEAFPDLTEFTTGELTATSMKYSNGSTVGLYSTCNETTIMRHWKWMKDYQVDGAWIQRFAPPYTSPTDHYNKTLLACMKGAETYGRVFVMMYDVSSSSNSSLFKSITTDWIYLVDQLKMTESSRYLRHNGKPLVSVWGMGFPDRSITPEVASQIIKWFQTDAPAKYQATIMVGVISSGRDDWKKLPFWAPTIRTADIISPWYVGSFGAEAADQWKSSRISTDLAECKRIGKDFLPVVWPGFSWNNLHGGPRNQIPRLGGKFFWNQVYNCISAGSTMLYNAMYDEIDEGTAMFKVCPKQSLAPVNCSDYWLTLDADGYDNLPSDWYLRLAGYAKKMLCGQIPLSATMPLDPKNPTAIRHFPALNQGKAVVNMNISVERGVLHLSDVKNEKAEVSLFLVNGTRCMKASFAAGHEELSIPLTIPGGVYILKVSLGNRAPMASKIVMAR